MYSDKTRERLQAKIRKNQEEMVAQAEKMIGEMNALEERAANAVNSRNLRQALSLFLELLTAIQKFKATKFSYGSLTIHTSVDKTLVNAHFMLGRCYYQLQDYNKAYEHLQAAQRLDSN